ncbi:MAG: M24 family metallopeptidase [Gemmatimonas sp.]|jgi:Xaa-Pro aminopeptidase|uniref:M24 family metallopeptidase n=1 Tax=Gemmatimonas sp. TaxID=1962908 RepID=UPI00391F7FE1|nr:aminopeptidase P family protein [Gemmatimonadota bacterium]
MMVRARCRLTLAFLSAWLLPTHASAQPVTSPATPGARHSGSTAADTLRPFGLLRDQAAQQQRWLELRLERTLPALMRREGVDLWVVPMREYNEDPLFKAITSPTTFAARRRTIYVFFDRGPEKGVERIALGGTSQGNVFKAVRSMKPVPAPAAGSRSTDRQAELWGDEQWQVLKQVIEERQPKKIALNTSRTFAFADGLSSGEKEGMLEALGAPWTSRIVPAEALAVDLIAARQPEEEAAFRELNRVAWEIIREAFSNKVITPGVTKADDVLWWMRQRVNDLGLGTWFQPSVEVQRQFGSPELVGVNPTILRGDVLHCDFGITAMGLNTDTQHNGYVLREGETDVPAGLKKALANSNRLQDITLEELKPGRTGNEVLKAVLTRMRAEKIDGTEYSHPIGLHGHGAGALIGLWDYQDGVPGRGDHKIIPGMWYSIELQATTAVPEWNNQLVRSAQEEDVIIDATGKVRWAYGRQTTFHLVR